MRTARAVAAPAMARDVLLRLRLTARLLIGGADGLAVILGPFVSEVKSERLNDRKKIRSISGAGIPRGRHPGRCQSGGTGRAAPQDARTRSRGSRLT
ncbi:hypothetical protein GCM10017562_46000 [Streptomyces roseofulvus]